MGVSRISWARVFFLSLCFFGGFFPWQISALCLTSLKSSIGGGFICRGKQQVLIGGTESSDGNEGDISDSSDGGEFHRVAIQIRNANSPNRTEMIQEKDMTADFHFEFIAPNHTGAVPTYSTFVQPRGFCRFPHCFRTGNSPTDHQNSNNNLNHSGDSLFFSFLSRNSHGPVDVKRQQLKELVMYIIILVLFAGASIIGGSGLVWRSFQDLANKLVSACFYSSCLLDFVNVKCIHNRPEFGADRQKLIMDSRHIREAWARLLVAFFG